MSETRRVLALIPARGGSKGIPRKNLAPLAGKPLLAYTVEQALATPEVDRVVVTTDDDEIARLASEWGAGVIRRPAELASDTASSESALVHALEALALEGYKPDLVAFLQATSPLRREGDVSRAIQTLDQQGADSLFSASPVHGFVWRRHGGRLEALTYDPGARPRRQDIGEDLLENGSIYLFAPWVLERHGNRLGGKIAVYAMDPLDSFQVDEPGDLELFERLLALRPPHRGADLDLSPIRLLVLDFDGVLTDNRVIVHQDGGESVRCDRGDGFGLERLRRGGRVEALVLSKETNPVVAARCSKLRLPCFQGYDDKLPELARIASERGLEAAQIAYVGNDLGDLEAMTWCGVAIAVADAVPEVRAAAGLVTRRPGGRGAVREVCDLLLAAGQDP